MKSVRCTRCGCVFRKPHVRIGIMVKCPYCKHSHHFIVMDSDIIEVKDS